MWWGLGLLVLGALGYVVIVGWWWGRDAADQEGWDELVE